jgi:hypothetical protein
MRLPNQSGGVTRRISAIWARAGAVPAQQGLLPAQSTGATAVLFPSRCPSGWLKRCIHVELEPGTTWRICWCTPTQFTLEL